MSRTPPDIMCPLRQFQGAESEVLLWRDGGPQEDLIELKEQRCSNNIVICRNDARFARPWLHCSYCFVCTLSLLSIPCLWRRVLYDKKLLHMVWDERVCQPSPGRRSACRGTWHVAPLLNDKFVVFCVDIDDDHDLYLLV